MSMPLNWILHPAAPYLLQAAGLGLCIYLFATLKHEIRGLERRSNQRYQELESLTESFRTATREITARLQETEERAGVLVAPAPPKSGLNLSKRSQVLRMSRHGHAPDKIASVLALPQNEVDLLLKVHRIMLSQLSGVPTARGLSREPSSAASEAVLQTAIAPESP
jgi:hypothetical protein